MDYSEPYDWLPRDVVAWNDRNQVHYGVSYDASGAIDITGAVRMHDRGALGGLSWTHDADHAHCMET